MTGIEGLLAILIVVLMPVVLVIVTRHYAFREKELALRGEVDARRLKQLVEEKQQLEARIENLESIVCTVEFELDQRLHGLCEAPPAMLSEAARAAVPAGRSRALPQRGSWGRRRARNATRG